MKEGVIAPNNTAMEFDAIRKEFYDGQRCVLDVRHLGSRHASPSRPYGLPKEEEAFFKDWGWIAAPAA